MILVWVVALLPLVALASMTLRTWVIARKVEQMFSAQGQFVDVPGARMHYLDMGPRNAPVVVLVHGILAQMRHFTYALADKLAVDHRVILVDRPGWGHSRVTGPRPGIAAQAAMVAALLDKLGVDQVLLAGHSMGGALSLALALDHPARLRGLALIAPYTRPVDKPPAPFRSLLVPPALRKLVAWTVALPIAIRTGPEKSRQVFAPDPVPADFGIKAGGVLTILPRSFESGAHELRIARADMAAIAARYGELKLPVAILYGREDALLAPALHGGRTAEAIAGARLTLVEGGHMLPIVYPLLVEEWLRSL